MSAIRASGLSFNTELLPQIPLEVFTGKAPVPEFSISNRLDLLNRLNALQCVVEIQTDLESSFFIGKIEEVKTSIFRWKSMDNRGKWENDLRQLRVRDIVSINVNTDYVTSLVAYNQSL